MAEIKLPSAPKTKPDEEIEVVSGKVISKVVEDTVTVKKRSIAARIRDILLADDVENVKDYAFKEVIVPGLKHLIVNSVSMLVLGETSDYDRRSSRKRERLGYATRYEYDDDRKRRRRDDDDDISSRHDYDTIIFRKIRDAERVRDDMYDLLREYDYVSLKDFYTLVGEKSDVFDDNWGWTDLKGLKVKSCKGGYYLTLSKPRPID